MHNTKIWNLCCKTNNAFVEKLYKWKTKKKIKMVYEINIIRHNAHDRSAEKRLAYEWQLRARTHRVAKRYYIECLGFIFLLLIILSLSLVWIYGTWTFFFHISLLFINRTFQKKKIAKQVGTKSGAFRMQKFI